jgi:hypothetical protein
LIRLVLFVVVPPVEVEVLVFVVCATALVSTTAAITAITYFFMAPAFLYLLDLCRVKVFIRAGIEFYSVFTALFGMQP